jgi:Ca2+-binding EF-hand superfamily protein
MMNMKGWPHMRLPMQIGLTVLALAGVADAQAQMRFQAMDSDRDGRITRDEWRGNDRSFRQQDWNGDGVLSGDEVRPGGRRQDWNQDWNRDGIVDNEDAQITQRFRGYDMNSDARIAASEWPGEQRLFTRLDTNRDRFLTIQEYTSGAGFRLDAQGGPALRFGTIDADRDGAISRNEWNLGDSDFRRLDVNRDNRISRFEFENDTATSTDTRYSPAQFSNLDVNRDGWVTRSESRMSSAQFSQFDTNSDNRISRFEFDNVASYNDSDDDPSSYDRFAMVDANRDGWLARSEWRGSEPGFNRLDTNRDNRLSRTEYDAEIPVGAQTRANNAGPTSRSAAWRAGYDRGTLEGEAAGREDYVRNQGWDLDGQRELERADSGYNPQVGALSDYQAGYRDGFRNAYRSGYMSARDNR